MADQFRTDSYRMEQTQLEFIEAEVEARIKEYGITLEINGEIIDITEIKRFPGEMKIIAVYHYAPGFSSVPDSYRKMKRKPLNWEEE